MWLVFKDYVYDGFQGPFLRLKLAKKGIEPWHARLWRDWAGVGLIGLMCYRDDWGEAEKVRTRLHEGMHCWQELVLGGLYFAVYWTDVLFIWLFIPLKHPYLDCWFEIQARKAAGQQITFTTAEWPDGNKDRWPWW